MRCVLDLDELGGVLCQRARLGDHRCDRLTHVANLSLSQDRMGFGGKFGAVNR